MLRQTIGLSLLVLTAACGGSGKKRTQQPIPTPPASAAPVEWGSIAAVPPGFADGIDDVGLASVVRDATLSGDGATSPLGVDLAAVQARIAGACAPGAFMTGVSGAGAPDCAAAPTLRAGAGLLEVDGTVAVGFGGSGSSTLAARSDHAHPVFLPLFPRMFECGGCTRDDNAAGFGGFEFKEVVLRSPTSCAAGFSNAAIGLPVPTTLPDGPRPFRLRLAFKYTNSESEAAQLKVRWGLSAEGTVDATCGGAGETLSVAAGPRALATVSERFEPTCGGPGSYLALLVERTGSARGDLHLVAADVTFE